MTDLALFVENARRHLSPVLERSGNVLYSSAATLVPGPIYLLGLNPGGDPVKHQAQTLARCLDELPSKSKNEYLDVSWQGRPAGESLLQRRVRWLLTGLGQNPRDTCAANLIFLRSTGADKCGYPNLARTCWPVHLSIIDIVQPKLIIAFGNSGTSPYAWIRSVWKGTAETTYPSGHGDWECRSFKANGVRIVGLPHLSRYAIDRHDGVAAWMRSSGPS